MTSKFYFIPTDENLHHCRNMPRNLLETITGATREKFDRIRENELCIYYAIYNENCIDYEPATVLQHSFFINLLLQKLKRKNINKLTCIPDLTAGGVVIPPILLFIDLGVNSFSSFEKYRKYFTQSRFIFDWSKFMTAQQFNYRDKIAYYRFAETQNPEINSMIPQICTNFEQMEQLKWYLLKDIDGSGGSGIYPIIKNRENNIFSLDERNELTNITGRTFPDFFTQKFITPFSVSGQEIIGILLLPREYITCPSCRVDEDTLEELMLSYYHHLTSEHNIDELNATLFTIYIFNFESSPEYSYFDIIRLVSNFIQTNPECIKKFYDYGYNEEQSFKKQENFKKFMLLLNIFNHPEKRFFLKFRRYYLHFNWIEQTIQTEQKRIIPFNNFDVDIIFDDKKDLSVIDQNELGPHVRDNIPDFNLFISNNTSKNTTVLEVISRIIDPDRGTYLLFEKCFTEEQKVRILAEEQIIFSTLVNGVKINDTILRHAQDKVYFKHYANDYIIGTNFKLWMLETNDSPVVQKRPDEFASLIIDIVNSGQGGGFKLNHFDNKPANKQDDKYMKKYLKYKAKYLQLKNQNKN